MSQITMSKIEKLRKAAEKGGARSMVKYGGPSIEDCMLINRRTLLALIDRVEDQLATIAKYREVLQATTRALGDHYCGVCGNADKNTFDDDQPYSDVTNPETETCDGCRGNWEAWRAGRELLDVRTWCQERDGKIRCALTRDHAGPCNFGASRPATHDGEQEHSDD